jgi:hypothetical protein
MPLKSYLIGPYSEGQMTNIEPWLLPEDAFEFLGNAYVWRGRVRKRFGTSYLGDTDLDSRLRIDLGDTDGNGDISVTVPGAVFKVGQQFSIDDEIITVVETGTPGTMITTGSSTTTTFDTTTGALVIVGAAATTACYYYPAEPVMGLRLRESSNVNFEDTVGFDTQFAYRRSSGAWERLGTALWTGDNADFYWTYNYRGTNPYETFMYVVNNVPADNIKYIPAGSTTWTNLRPQLDSGATRYLETARLLIGFRDRLIALNTVEDESGTDRTYRNRARWSQNGDPTAASTGWLDDTPGRGGYVDAPVEQNIITAEFIRDQLIVYFERSTWELVYTGDATLPFRWQQLNNELGAESTFSIIGFDDKAVGVGNVGIHACNGVQVGRIDEKIPNAVFSIHNGNDGPARVYGVRDYYRQMVYWTFPSDIGDPTYPTSVLAYNYAQQTWGFFEDTFTCFGYFQKDADLAWSDLGRVYGTWANWNDPWVSPTAQSQFPDIVAGNQQGYTFLIRTEKTSNEKSLSITDMDAATEQLTVVDHNLRVDDYVLVEDCEGITSLNDTVYQVQTIVDEDTITLDTSFSGTYTGNGKLRRISNLNILSKQWNPGTPIGQGFSMPYMDFLLDRTTDGEVTLHYMIDTTNNASVNESAMSGVLLGSDTLFTRPEASLGSGDDQVRIWHRYFLQAECNFLQIKIFMDDDQMRDTDIAWSDFQLNASIIYAEPGGRITG